MKKSVLCFGMLCCLFMGCSDEGGVGSKKLITDRSEMTLYYDIPGKVKLIYRPEMEIKVAESNNCIDILTEEIKTNSRGIAYLEMKARVFTCDEPRKVIVCDALDDAMCAEFMIRTTTDENEIDTNHNLMIDEYETNTDKDKYTQYVPGDCSSFCYDDADCDDFCDSAIGNRCSKRCTSNDQCIKYKENDEWVSMICRQDGRCAYPSLKAVYNINKDNTTITFGGKPLDENVTIDWGDGTVEPVPTTTNNDLSHTYQTKGQYKILLTGEYSDWTAGCSDNVELFDIYQFGTVGLGYNESLNYGTFWNCFTFNKISAKDIPDASKLTDMSYMFAGEDPSDSSRLMKFNHESIANWDTSNVKAMRWTFYHTGFINSHGEGFNQDVGRWNTSNVKSMERMFYISMMFNQNIGCWDVSSVKNISRMFEFSVAFTQHLNNWDLGKVTNHDHVFSEQNSGKFMDVGLEAYCILRNKLHKEDIGRENSACRHGLTYGQACNNDTYKKVISNCYEKYLKTEYPELSEDDVNCGQLWRCLEAIGE